MSSEDASFWFTQVVGFSQNDAKLCCLFFFRYWDKRPYHEVLNTQALTADRIETRRSLYGINKIDVSLTPIIRLVLNGVSC